MKTTRPARYRRSLVTFALGALCAAAASCMQDPAAPDVSDTEIWRLELEQTEDGTSATFPRRGTINLLLRLNHTTTPDPACANRPNPNATTFLASVEAVPSRLQGPARGNAVGTWNCFGFSAEVRLDDGSIYSLVSDSLKFSPGTPHWQVPMAPNSWVAGERRGYFGFGVDALAGILFDTHLDVRVQNRSGRTAHITPLRIDGAQCWNHRDLPQLCFSRASGDYRLRFAEIQSQGSDRLAWPASHLDVPWPNFRSPSLSPFTDPYLINVQFGDTPYRNPDAWTDQTYITCYLRADHPPQVEIIIHADESLECSTGWVGSVLLTARPGRLFLRAGASDTVFLIARSARGLDAVSSHPNIGALVLERPGGDFDLRNADLVVNAAQNAAPTEYGVTVRSESTYDTARVVIPVEVYDLGVTATPDTLTLVRGGAGTSRIRLNRAGLLGLDVELSVPNLPANVLSVPPSFSPRATSGDSSRLTLSVDPAATPGNYDLTVCAIIVGDPRQTCHPARVTLRVRSFQNSLPSVTITSPQNGLTAPYTTTITFSGSAQDAEDGNLTGNALVWTSSIDGPIGTGDILARRLSVGAHTIRLTATDGDGGSASASVAITITDPNPSASVSGRVTGNGFGIGGATLTLTGPVSANTTTDGTGNYSFTSLPAGTYSITVSTPFSVTFPARTQTVTLAPGQAVTVNFAGTY